MSTALKIVGTFSIWVAAAVMLAFVDTRLGIVVVLRPAFPRYCFGDTGVRSSNRAPNETLQQTGIVIDALPGDPDAAFMRIRTRPLLGSLAFDWAVATGDRRTRAVRNMATDLKPAVRSLLVRRGWPALDAWRMTWTQLAESWQSFNPAAGKCLERTIGMLPAHPDEEQAAGELLLTLLSAVAADSVDLQTE